jgi:hypothetical protein
MVSEVTALFTTGKGSLGNGRPRLSAAKTQVCRIARQTGPASHRSSRDRLHGTSRRPAGFEPTLFQSEVSEVFTTSELDTAQKRRDCAAAQCGPGKTSTVCRGALARNGAPPSEPRLVRPAIGGPRECLARRSLRRAPRFGRPRQRRAGGPGIRVSLPPEGRHLKRSARGEGSHEKPLRSGCPGGVREMANLCRSGQPEPLP